MKTIFITVAEPSATRNLLRGKFWEAFRAGLNARVVLVTAPDRLELYRREFADTHVCVEALPRPPRTHLGALTAFVARNTLRTGTVMLNQMRGPRASLKGYVAFCVKRLLWNIGGHSRLLQRAVRSLDLRISPSDAVRALFDHYHPDGLFSTVAINENIDIPMLREAKRRGISTIGMYRGWDNFTSHGFMRMAPDRILLQDQYLFHTGVAMQHLNPMQLEVVGFPSNDWYFQHDLILPRDVFFRTLGIDPRRRMILYGAMGDGLFPHEGEIAEVFEEMAETHMIPEDCVMVFRAHPAFPSPLERIKGMRYVVPDRNVITLGGQVHRWEMGEKEVAHLINSIVHSEMMVTAGSTMALDALVLGKPAISVAFEKTRAPFWWSAGRFWDHFTHFEDMMATGGVSRADTAEAFAAAINAYLKDPSRDQEGRARCAAEFFEPNDGHVGERIAERVRLYLDC